MITLPMTHERLLGLREKVRARVAQKTQTFEEAREKQQRILRLLELRDRVIERLVTQQSSEDSLLLQIIDKSVQEIAAE